MADLSSIITEAANRYGLPPEMLLRIAQIESRMNPNAANENSSAKGVFQFVDDTWKQYGRGQNVLDPHANIDAGARFTKDNMSFLRARLGREPAPWEVYLAHQQGAGGAGSLLADPRRLAVQALSHDAVIDNAGRPDMTAGDFADKWKAKYEGTAVPGATGVAGGAASSALASAAGPNSALASGLVPQRREDLMLGSLFSDVTASLAQKPVQQPLVQRQRKSVGELIGDLGAPVRLSG